MFYSHFSGCDKVKVRGHKCSFRVKLTMRLGFVDHWFVEIMGSHNCYIVSERESGGGGAGGIDASPPPNDMDKMLADYEMKSSDGEDSDLNGGLSQGLPSAEGSPLMTDSGVSAAQAGVLNLLQSGALDSKKFLLSTPTSPPTSDISSIATSSTPLMNLPSSSLPSSPFPMLLSPAHCPINVPLFSESYLEAMARNAAAAVAMSECGVIPPSPVSVSPLTSPLKKDAGIASPSTALPNGLGLVGADQAGSFGSGFLHPPPMIIPRFGFLPPLPLASDSKQNIHIPVDEKVMDLSTPKQSKRPEAIDCSGPQDLSAKKSSNINGYCGNLKRTLSPASSLAQMFPDPNQKALIARQALTKSPSLAASQSSAQKQADSKNSISDTPIRFSPQHQNGGNRGSNPKRQRKNPPCPSYSASSFSKSSNLGSIRDSKCPIPSSLLSPKHDSPPATTQSTSLPSSIPPSMSSLQASSASAPLSCSRENNVINGSSSSSKSQERQLSSPADFNSVFIPINACESLVNRHEKGNACSNSNTPGGASGKSDKPMDKVENVKSDILQTLTFFVIVIVITSTFMLHSALVCCWHGHCLIEF